MDSLTPRYRPRRLRRPDEPIEWETTNPSRGPDRFTRTQPRPRRERSRRQGT